MEPDKKHLSAKSLFNNRMKKEVDETDNEFVVLETLKEQGIEVSKTKKLTSFKQISSVALFGSKNWSDESDTEGFEKQKIAYSKQIGNKK